MSTRLRRAATLAAATVVAVATAPAHAQVPVGAEVGEIPAVLDADLSTTETATLAELTAGSGVGLEAFVRTPGGAEVVALDAGSTADAAAAARLLAAQPSVAAANPAVPVRIAAGSVAQYGNAMLRSEAARAEVDGSLSDVVVAVLDTGVAPHPELAAALLPGQNFSDSPGGAADVTDLHGHGTHVAGTVAADAGSQVEGVAAGARVLPVKVLRDDGSGSSTWANQGIVWAADNGADVINLSFGGTNASGVYAEAVAYARARGVTVVGAAGNNGDSVPFWPAAEQGVLAVAAVDQNSDRAPFSNLGSYVDLAAPGVGIASTDRAGGTIWKSGTSMAAPHVAGVAALVEATAPGLTPDQVEQALVASGTDLGAPGRDDHFGHGLVDAVRAVRAAEEIERTGSLPGNTTPVAGGDVLALPAGATSGVVDVLADDTDADGDALAVTAVGGAVHGRVTLEASQRVRWTADAAHPRGATDSFRYTVSDGRGGTATATVTVTVAPARRPGAPAVGRVTSSGSVARVRWSPPVADGGSPVTGYRVYVYRSGALVSSADAPATARDVLLRGLVRGKGHRFGVRAITAAGIGGRSVLTPTVVPRTKPGAPRLTRPRAAKRAAVVRWATPSSTGGAAIRGYVVRTYAGSRLVRSTPVPASARSLTVRSLAPGKRYRFRVQARNVAGLGAYSPASAVVRPAR